MTVSSSTNRVSYAGNGSTTVFPYTYKIFDEDDLTVIVRAANGTETVKTITSDYTVSGVGSAGGGNVTMLTAPATGETLVILREQDLVQELDIVPNDPFPADSLEAALDKLTFMVQQHEETLDRTIKASRTNTIAGSEFTISAANRANKIFAFDSAGDLSIAQELGTYRGNWAASTAYNQRDIVKDGGNDNLYFCNTAHTSSGSLPISTNTDVAKWDLLLDVSAFTTLYDQFDDRYLGAKSSDPATDNDGNTLIDGALYWNTTDNRLKVYDLGNTTWKFTAPSPTEQTAINTVAAIAADVSTVAGIDSDVTAVAADATDIGTVASNISNVNTVAGISSDVTAVAGDATDIGTVAGISANVTTVAGISAGVTTVAGISANVTTVAGISADVTAVAGDATDIGTVATNIADVSAVAAIDADVTTVAGISADVTTVATNVADVTNFADVYVGPSATDPTTRTDSSALQAGDLYFNTATDQMFVYDGSAWSAASFSNVNPTFTSVTTTSLTVNGNNYPSAGSLGNRNKIINGAMVIDQRNAGAAVTIDTTANIYTVDRWIGSGQATDGVFTVDQTTDAPAGFTNSLRITVTTADASIGATQNYLLQQFVEGFNAADLDFGKSSAKDVTLSFWVRSSLTGTFGGALGNSANDRAYPFTYSISSANTWEYKTITIAGDTTGTWLTDNGRGLALRFQIGMGSSRVAAAGAWTGTSSIFGATGATNIIETLNATWDITGVQLEAGDVSTPFEHRSYGQELALCQRYYEVGRLYGSAYHNTVTANANDYFQATYCFKQTKRAAPTVASTNLGTGTIATQVADVDAAAFRRTGAFDSPLDITLTASSEL